MIHSSFEELIDDLSDYKGYANSSDLTQEELRDILAVSLEFITFLDDKIYTDSKYGLFRTSINSGRFDKHNLDGFKRALNMARRYSEADKLPSVVRLDMVLHGVNYAKLLQDELDNFAIDEGIIEQPNNHFTLFKSVLEEKQSKLKRPRLYAISIDIDSILAVEKDYIVATTPIEALSKLDFANKIGSRPESVKIEIIKITDVTA